MDCTLAFKPLNIDNIQYKMAVRETKDPNLFMWCCYMNQIQNGVLCEVRNGCQNAILVLGTLKQH